MVTPPRYLGLATGLGSQAEATVEFPGIPSWRADGLRIIVVPDEEAFRQASGGRLPSWGMALAVPAERIVVIRADAPDPARALTHELAHVALFDRVKARLPLWFSEGYAVVAARELGRLRALELNLAVARGAVTELRDLDAALRREGGDADAAYALAGTAAAHLLRLQPTGSYDALFDRLAAGERFDSAVVAATGYDMARFERSWRETVRRRYSVALWLIAGGWWAVAGLAVLGIVWLRRRRDRARRAALDVGWPLPPEAAEELDRESPYG